MKLTKLRLEKRDACSEGIEWFENQKEQCYLHIVYGSKLENRREGLDKRNRYCCPDCKEYKE